MYKHDLALHAASLCMWGIFISLSCKPWRDCARLKAILSDMTFEKGRARTEAMTVRQCEDIIAAANGMLIFPPLQDGQKNQTSHYHP